MHNGEGICGFQKLFVDFRDMEILRVKGVLVLSVIEVGVWI
jgi:hypothetical protein